MYQINNEILIYKRYVNKIFRNISIDRNEDEKHQHYYRNIFAWRIICVLYLWRRAHLISVLLTLSCVCFHYLRTGTIGTDGLTFPRVGTGGFSVPTVLTVLLAPGGITVLLHSGDQI